MSVRPGLMLRSKSKCEMCSSSDSLKEYLVVPKSGEHQDDYIVACTHCINQIENLDTIVPNHWRCLNESMWSEVPAVQVMAYRMLKKLNGEGWAQDLLGMIYLDPETLEWAQMEEELDNPIIHKDSNGHILETGDTVVLIKDLNVKGANFTAKRGMAVRRIRLVHDNAEHIEGKVDGQQIVILTKFVKKS